VTPDQAIHSTGLLANSDPGYIQSPPSTGSGTAWYAVDGLPQNQPLTFFVTSYSADGTVSTQSIDTLGTVLAPSGPLVTRVTSSTCPTGVSSPCPYGGGGSTIVVTAGGTGFGGGAAMMLVQSGRSVGLGTCSASPCSLTAPTGLTGLWSIVATAGGVSSPPIPASDFDFGPAIQSVSPSSGTALQKVTITGTNFLLGTTFTFTYPTGSGPEGLYTWTAGPTASTTSYTCTTAQSATVGGISCSFVMPSFTGQLLANGLTQSTGELSATSLGGTSTTTPGDVFTYTIA
jgi:hypothetical protein